MSNENNENIVIIGGGIIGVCSAYYLSERYKGKITLIEQNDIASCASGKAGGFLAKDWYTSQLQSLGDLSFKLHDDLNKLYNGERNWQYRKLKSSNVLVKALKGLDDRKPKPNVALENLEDIEEFRPRPPASSDGVTDINWIFKPSKSEDKNARGVILHELVSDEDTTAQVDPYKFTKFIFNECVKNGVEYIKSSPKSIENETIHLDNYTQVKFSKLLLCAGPWTSSLFETLFPFCDYQLPIDNLPGYSLIIKPKSVPSPHAIFTTILGAGDSMSGSPELFSRPDNTIFVAGENTGPILPKSSNEVDKIADLNYNNWDRLFKSVNELGIDSTNSEIVKKQLCYRPITNKRKPLISSLDTLGLKNVFVCSGHGPWVSLLNLL